VLRGVLADDYLIKATVQSRDAVDIARASQPDLILLDVMMPDLDGYGVCRSLKEDPATRGIPIIFITTLSDAPHESRGLRAGAVDYITKPYVPDLVRSRVRTHVALHHQNTELERLVAARTSELVETRLEIIRRLCRAAELRDNETGMHVLRMSHYSRLVSLAAGDGDSAADLVLNAAPMHDIGKIGIPDNVLLKPGGLSHDEWEIMKGHTISGAHIIGEHPSELLTAARDVALCHHEKWDGTGYPSGLRGTDIPRIARIVALADVFDALTSPRPYKNAWTIESAVDFIRAQRGRHFEPVLVDAFMRALPQCLEIGTQYRDA
jgi:putative two-component system response regulator